jgi:Cu/Zn superoxide dismutase
MKISMLALTSLLVIAACGGGSNSTPPPVAKVSLPIAAQNGSSVTGTAEVVKGAGSFTLTVKLTGLAPNSSHVSHIHDGRCAAPGGVAYALQQTIADGSGAATAVTVIPTGYSIPTAGWYVNIHHGPDFSAPPNAPSVACGDMPHG